MDIDPKLTSAGNICSQLVTPGHNLSHLVTPCHIWSHLSHFHTTKLTSADEAPTLGQSSRTGNRELLFQVPSVQIRSRCWNSDLFHCVTSSGGEGGDTRDRVGREGSAPKRRHRRGEASLPPQTPADSVLGHDST